MILAWVTCRNYECYLPEALASLQLQSSLPSIVVAHDACGTGHPPIGVAANRNRALEWGMFNSHEYVVFLDADDHLPPNYIEELYGVAGGAACVVTCDAFRFGVGPNVGPLHVRRPVTLESLLEQNTVHCSAMIHTSLFRRFHFDPTLASFEDWELWCRMAAAGIEFRHCSTIQLHYRQHPDSRHSTKRENWAAFRRILQHRFSNQ